MVSYSELFQLLTFIVALISLVISIDNRKKMNRPTMTK